MQCEHQGGKQKKRLWLEANWMGGKNRGEAGLEGWVEI